MANLINLNVRRRMGAVVLLAQVSQLFDPVRIVKVDVNTSGPLSGQPTSNSNDATIRSRVLYNEGAGYVPYHVDDTVAGIATKANASLS